MVRPNIFGIKNLRWKWLDSMAETGGRRPLQPGERRKGHGRGKFIDSDADDRLFIKEVEERGHPILVAAIEHLQSSSPELSQEDALLFLLRFWNTIIKKKTTNTMGAKWVDDNKRVPGCRRRPQVCLSINRSWRAL
jgi:hypothetical protein